MSVMRSLLKHLVGVALTIALGWLLVIAVNAFVAEGIARLVLLAPGLFLVPVLVSGALRLNWFANIGSWKYGQSGFRLDI
jgi:hypothetical protein